MGIFETKVFSDVKEQHLVERKKLQRYYVIALGGIHQLLVSFICIRTYFSNINTRLCRIFLDIKPLCKQNFVCPFCNYLCVCGKVKYESRVQIHEFRIQIHELRDQIHELRVQIHELEKSTS